MVTIVNNTVLHTWKLSRVVLSVLTIGGVGNLCEVIDMLIILMSFHNIHAQQNQYTAHFKYIQLYSQESCGEKKSLK